MQQTCVHEGASEDPVPLAVADEWWDQRIVEIDLAEATETDLAVQDVRDQEDRHVGGHQPVREVWRRSLAQRLAGRHHGGGAGSRMDALGTLVAD